MSELPETLFKYEGFTTRSLLSFKKQSLYFGSPRNFNDPYDCAITLPIAEPTREELNRVREYFLMRDDFSPDKKKQFEKMSLGKIKSELVKGVAKAVGDARDAFLDKKGVTCFSERNDNLLMWAHYGGKYKGFCLEFRTDGKPFDKVRKVKYVNKIPDVRVASVIDDDYANTVVDMFCTKSDAWEYEQEWRGIHEKAGTIYTYKPESLKAVYFGPDIEFESIEIMSLILAGQNPDVELWQGFRSKTEFKVEFKKATYTAHIDAKRQGLV